MPAQVKQVLLTVCCGKKACTGHEQLQFDILRRLVEAF